MADIDMEAVMANTQQALGGLFRKPKLTTKLLSRPPFRYIHDVIFAVSKATGFPDLSVFDESEMVGKAIKDKTAKINFLRKAIQVLEDASGEQVTMRPEKAVAGAESHTVNEFFQLLARTARGGGANDEGKGPEDDGKAAEAEQQAAAQRARDEEENRRRAAEAAEAERAAREQERLAREREAAAAAERARAAAEAEAAAAASKMDEGGKMDDGGGKEDGGDPSDPFSGPVQVDTNWETTADLVSRLISKPRMSQKHLSRPPYRFLHDIVSRLSAKTGFGDGLFAGDELNPKTKDRDVKLSFLSKIISCVALHLNVTIRARPAKIAAGLEAELTNEFLQYLAFAATRGDSRDAVSRVLAGETQPEAGGSPEDNNNNNNQAEDDGRAAAEAAQREREDRARREQQEAARKQQEAQRQAAAEAQRQREQAAAAQAAEAAARAEEEQRRAQEAAAAAAAYGGGGGAANANAGGDAAAVAAPSGPSGGVRRLARPTTARRRPPRVRENAEQVVGAEKKPVGAVGIMKEGEESDSDDEPAPGEPETKAEDVFGGGNAAGGAGKLTRDILNKQQAAEKAKGTGSEGKPAATKATGIRMGRIKKSRGAGGAYSQVDIEKLRGFIQKLCQSTNPLGKCMDYVLEDIESMKGELASWKADYRRRCQDLETEEEVTRDAIIPLQQELKQADARIEEEVQKINTVKAKIAKNDARIQELLRMVVSW